MRMRNWAVVPLATLIFSDGRVNSFVLPPTVSSRWLHPNFFCRYGLTPSMRGRTRDALASKRKFHKKSSVSSSRRGQGSEGYHSRAVIVQRALARGLAAPTLSMLISSEAVSCFRHPDVGSDVWLVGLCHRTQPSVELVKEVICEVKPQVVMVELDAHRSRLLPPGEVHKGEDGLCWWREDTQRMTVDKPSTRRKKAKPSAERGEQGVEFHAAAVEACACGAKVLLGDRDFEDILRRQDEAKAADEKQAKKNHHKRRRASLDMDKMEGLIARRSALGEEVPVTREIMRKWSAAMRRLRPKEHAANVTERDEVMSRNLMKLKGGQTTVAVVGFGHLDGIESILEANGWKRQAHKD